MDLKVNYIYQYKKHNALHFRFEPMILELFNYMVKWSKFGSPVIFVKIYFFFINFLKWKLRNFISK